MKIGIHGIWMDSDPYGGVSTYLANLIENLGYLDKENEYTIYYGHSRALEYSSYLPSRFRARVLRPSSLWIGIPVSLPLEILRRPVDLLHVNVIAPPICPCPFVQTIHDLSFELNPEVFPRLIRMRLSRLVPSTARRAKKIITVSKFVKKCIMDFYRIPEEKIVVAYNGINPAFRQIEDPGAIEDLRSRYNIRDEFIFYVGKIQPRKNIQRLIKAFHILKRERHLPHKLVLVGRTTWLSSEIIDLIDELDLKDEVILPGEVPLDDVVLFYNAAALSVYPSLSEGFGIPPLEAMACGTPVVASNTTSIPEVVGNAGALVDPYNVENIAQAIYDVITKDQLREQYISQGLKRIKKYSYRKMAEQVLKVYTEVLNKNK